MFDRFDICEAWYVYAMGYHGGQFTRLYRVFDRLEKIKFRPRPNLSEETLGENAQEIYDSLVERKIYQ